MSSSTDNPTDPEPYTPIAICGIGLRLPGSITTASGLWDFLVEGRDARSEIPASRWNAAAFSPDAPSHGYFLSPERDLADFDKDAFPAVSRKEAEQMDPQQRLLMEVVQECLESAGEVGWQGSNVGVFVGSFADDYLDLQAKDPLYEGFYKLTGALDFAVANRISYQYDLRGPSVTVRTACSASLTALHQACSALQRGEIEAALVCGVNVMTSPTPSLALNNQGVLSPEGSCKTFDAAADGYARGEAITAILIRRFDDAQQAGSPVRAVIRATSVNYDGKGSSLGAPNPLAHEALIREAYRSAGLDGNFSKTAFVECHGTGTSVGDPLELGAVGNVFGGHEEGVYVGSVKPNLGHSEGASGLTSLIKAVLALENRTIPPNIKFKRPNPKIDFRSGRLKVPTAPVPWPQHCEARISVNSFGFGGSNAHVILDSAESFSSGCQPSNLGSEVSSEDGAGSYSSWETLSAPSAPSPQLLVFSASHEASLRRSIENKEAYLVQDPSSLPDLAYTLSSRREHKTHRAYSLVTDGKQPLEVSRSSKTGKTPPDLVFVFTGQGAQWPRMGAELLHEYPVFRNSFVEMERTLASLPEPCPFNLREELIKAAGESQVQNAMYSQPLCTALQCALVDLLHSLGLRASAVVGHSSGEIGAAYASGALSLHDAIIVAYNRGICSGAIKKSGAMGAVGVGRSDVEPLLRPGVVIGCENSPESVTISGDAEGVAAVLADVKASRPDVLARPLRVDKAYHSHHVGDVPDELWDQIEGLITPKHPQIPFFSSLYARQLKKTDNFSHRYWRANGENAVLFYPAVSALVKANPDPKVFLEIGPHGALAGPLRQILKALDTPYQYASVVQRNTHAGHSFLDGLGSLFLQGITPNFAELHTNNHNRKVLTDLPTYPWNYSTAIKFWTEPRLSREWRLKKHARHDLLGDRVTTTNALEPAWRNLLSTDAVPWIRDHVVQGNIVFPFVGFVSIAAAAASQQKPAPASPSCKTSDVVSLRNIVVRQALVMYDGRDVEISTTLRRARLTDSLRSDWWEFSISSYSPDSQSWTSHCTGEVQVTPGGNLTIGQDESTQSQDLESLPRSVNSGYWYKIMSRAGLAYGPEFTGLTDITADPTGGRARCSVARIDRSQASGKSPSSSYPIHPCEMDKCLQSVFVAMTAGLGRRFPSALVPVSIDEITIGKQTSTMRLDTRAQVEAGRGDVVGEITGYEQDNVVFRIKGLRASVLHGGNSSGDGDSAAGLDSSRDSGARVTWLPDVRFTDLNKLIRPRPDRRAQIAQLETLSLLNIIDLAVTLDPARPPGGYLGKHFQWLLKQFDAIKQGRSQCVPDCQRLIDLSKADRRNAILTLQSSLAETTEAAPAVAVTRAFEVVQDVFASKSGAVESLFSDDTLANLYRYMDFSYCSDFFRCLGHSRPTMRILEIGAGTGGATRTLLRSLETPGGEHMYGSYTFTDVSAGFFSAAKESLQGYPRIKYQVLDVSSDPVAQGFDEGGYDLIIAANVLHATPSLRRTLTNVKKLLKPDGFLFLQEVSLEATWISSIFGLLEGWWLGEEDGRVDEPYINAQRWDRELHNAGFNGTQVAAYDHERPYQVNVCIVSQPDGSLSNGVSPTAEKHVTLLSQKPGPVSASVAQAFTNRGYTIRSCRLGEQQASIDAVVSLLDLEEPVFYNMTPERLQSLQLFFKQCKASQIIWATNSSQVNCQDPRNAMTIGAIRTLRGELGLPITTVELDTTDEQALMSLVQVLEAQQHSPSSGSDPAAFTLDQDFEYAFSQGQLMVPRVIPCSVAEDLVRQESLRPNLDERLVLQAGNGTLDSLHWTTAPCTNPGDDEVEIDVHTTGLNFKDLLVAMFLVRDPQGELGLDGAGIVRKVGANVAATNQFRPGDRIMFYSGGAFTSRISIPAALCVRIPARLSLDAAATMPCVFATAIHALIELGGLRAGQTVLVHSACGAVGLAALQLCRLVGATVFATVGTDEKVAYLQKIMGIPRERIFSSRDPSFVKGVMERTCGRGVDVVLNSLSGELLHASWRCVAKFGRMIEVGKRDFQGRAKLQTSLFESNRSFFGVDLHEMAAETPFALERLLAKTIMLYEQGLIDPIPSAAVYTASAVQTAFRHVQQGKHIGKIVVRMPPPHQDLDAKAQSLSIARQTRELKLDSRASYLLVGGTGGLGRVVSNWLVEHGARHLIFLSRSAGKGSGDNAFANELASQGCTVQFFSGSITSQDDVVNAVQGAAVPIKGVLNLSMVLQDRAFLDMTIQDWDTAVLPKVQGTYNLHVALQDSPLDFFVLFGSFCGMIGQWSQANYAAANTFLDAFVQHRHRLGLPCSVMDIGVVEDHGYVSRSAELTATFRNWGAGTIQEHELLQGLHLSILDQLPPTRPTQVDGGQSHQQSILEQVQFTAPSQLMLGLKTTRPLSDPSTRVRWRRDARMAILHNDDGGSTARTGGEESGSKAGDAGLRELLRRAAAEPGVLDEAENMEALARAVGLKIYDLMLLPAEELDTGASLAAVGVDSLIVMEILSWWKATFGFKIGTLEFLNAGTIEGVARLAVTGLQKRRG